MLYDFEITGNPFQLLAAFDADLVPQFTATRAGTILFFKFMPPDLAFKMAGKLPGSASFALATLGRRVFNQLVAASVFLKLLGKLLKFLKRKQEQLIRIDSLLS